MSTPAAPSTRHRGRHRLSTALVLALTVLAMITGTVSPASAATSTTENLDVPLNGTFTLPGLGTLTLSGTAHLVIRQFPTDPIEPAVTRINTNLIQAFAANGTRSFRVIGAEKTQFAPASTKSFTLTYRLQPLDPVLPADPIRPTVSIRYSLAFDSTGVVTEAGAAAVNPNF
ncbi:hypothetical protein [Pseudarthrobacter sp. S9]|uniref:hypothetical protein n=1 Tax=Pseudarthrobacter sp. S9 TaxID=3418421 RepID=UPI003D00580E